MATTDRNLGRTDRALRTVARTYLCAYHPEVMRSYRRAEPEEPRPVKRSWDNSALRQRVEGKPIEGIDILALQSNVVAREPQRSRRRSRRSN